MKGKRILKNDYDIQITMSKDEAMAYIDWVRGTCQAEREEWFKRKSDVPDPIGKIYFIICEVLK